MRKRPVYLSSLSYFHYILFNYLPQSSILIDTLSFSIRQSTNLCGTNFFLGAVGFQLGNLSRPSSRSVFLSTMLKALSSSRSNLNGSLSDTGGLVIKRGMRLALFEPVCSIRGCSRNTSPTLPVTSTNSSQDLAMLL